MSSTLVKVKNKQSGKLTFYRDSVRIAECDYYRWMVRAWRVNSMQTKSDTKFIRFYTCIG